MISRKRCTDRARAAGRVGAIAVLLGSLAYRPAAGDAGSPDADALVVAASFVAQATNAPVPAVDLRRVDGASLSSIFAAGGGKASTEEVLALYLPRANRVLLNEHLDLGDPYDLSYLVHELVHAQQFATQRAVRAACPGKLEFEAYGIQARFLRDHGLTR
jgi:hypothetical protein